MVREQAAVLPAESTISASPNEATVVATAEFLDERKYPCPLARPSFLNRSLRALWRKHLVANQWPFQVWPVLRFIPTRGFARRHTSLGHSAFISRI